MDSPRAVFLTISNTSVADLDLCVFYRISPSHLPFEAHYSLQLTHKEKETEAGRGVLRTGPLLASSEPWNWAVTLPGGPIRLSHAVFPIHINSPPLVLWTFLLHFLLLNGRM